MLTVLFATYNGATTLPTMLEAFTAIEYMGEWEIVAVNNASTDATQQILDSFKDRLPLHAFHEPRRGKNCALNLGLHQARGDLIVFTDDDVIPQSDWLTCMQECVAGHPDYDVFGGRILPHWSVEPDPIILKNAPLGVTYALTPSEQMTGPIFPGLIWGPNMAVRKRVFDAGHRFNESIGPSDGAYIMGSETEFTIRVHEAGHHSWYCDAAQVKHIIRGNQMQRDWVISRAYRFGRNQWVQESKASFDVPCIAGIPRWYFSALVGEHLSLLSGLLCREHGQLFRARWEINFLKGYIHEGLKAYGRLLSKRP